MYNFNFMPLKFVQKRKKVFCKFFQRRIMHNSIKYVDDEKSVYFIFHRLPA